MKTMRHYDIQRIAKDRVKPGHILAEGIVISVWTSPSGGVVIVDVPKGSVELADQTQVYGKLDPECTEIFVREMGSTDEQEAAAS